MLLRLDGRGPRYAQITRALLALIQAGALRAGTRVPATRDLARDLGCSRNLVLLAYEQLALEGYLVTCAGAGTFVAPDLQQPPPIGRTSAAAEVPSQPDLSPSGRLIVTHSRWARDTAQPWRRSPIDFMHGVCEPDARVVGRFRRAFGETLTEDTFRYCKAGGDAELRKQLAERLLGARGISCTADEIVITNGAQQAMEICARLLLGAGDRVVVEDPGYRSAHATFAATGARLIPVPVDDHGLDLTAIPRRSKPARLVYITPSHQFPTGIVMSAPRRYALLEWAEQQGAYIIEDDYDGEFRYAGHALEALRALGTRGRVIYCGTFAKSLFPSVRLGFLVLPPALVSAAVDCKWLTDRGSSPLLQRALAKLMATGEYDRHIKRMQRRYRTRLETLIGELRTQLGSKARVQGSGAGLHVVVWLPELSQNKLEPLIAECAARGLGVYSISQYATRPLRHAGLLLGYGLVSPAQIERGIRELGKAYRAVTRS